MGYTLRQVEAESKFCQSLTVEALERAVDFENTANPFEERRTTISGWRQYATVDVEETAMLLQSANILAGMGLKAKDALHIVCAIAGECMYFVTTDDDILKRRQDVHDITVIDPTAFVREMNL